MLFLMALFRRLADLGAPPESPELAPDERRRVTLTNQCAVLAATTFASFALISIVFRFPLAHAIPWPLVAVNVLGASLELGVLWINARGLATLARYLLIVAACVG